MKYIKPDMETICFEENSLAYTLTVSETPGGSNGDGDLTEGGFAPVP